MNLKVIFVRASTMVLVLGVDEHIESYQTKSTTTFQRGLLLERDLFLVLLL